jgi:hypothetical protein
MKLELKPIGRIRSPHRQAQDTPIQPPWAAGIEGAVEIFPEFAPGLRELPGLPARPSATTRPGLLVGEAGRSQAVPVLRQPAVADVTGNLDSRGLRANPLGLRSVPRARSRAALGCRPRKLLLRGHRTIVTFGARSHGLSHRCLRFVPPSRATTQTSLPVVDQPFRVGLCLPIEFVGRVSQLHAFPSPRALLGAKPFSFLARFSAMGEARRSVAGRFGMMNERGRSSRRCVTERCSLPRLHK